jgi:hypothetical protein
MSALTNAAVNLHKGAKSQLPNAAANSLISAQAEANSLYLTLMRSSPLSS